MSLRAYLSERPVIEGWGPPARRLARRLYQKYFSLALILASAFHIGGLLVGWGVHKALTAQEAANETKDVRLVQYHELAAPPSLEQAPAEPPKFQIAPQKISAPPAAIPIPVVEEEAVATTIASQEQLPFADAEGDTGLGDEGLAGVPWGEEGGTGLVIEDVMPAPDDFIPVEEQPVIVEFKTPEYPRMAREAGIEGVVTVRALVGKDGKVRDAILGKGVHQLLDEAAIAAAKECVFKPAIQNKNPVAVWVAIPFNFHLQN
ncbi:MAG: energy transducer TonB [bacterium]